ncbi:lipocalin family protein [Mangrovivirga cuniculi]|uniref:Uncharacterized protein n=1 Tax=Mangrovivirga cuniculi TaxID=2715131 RepID=A0A4D7JKW9_9BACT|nr:lipocalin family protein [Mangrovivirga cuniculi]QCK14130.1 hypothetical protein DCC35_04915 [Mangrovivirga cuniculi]
MKNFLRVSPLTGLLFLLLIFTSCTEENIIVQEQPQSESPLVGEWKVTSIVYNEYQATYENEELLYDFEFSGYAYDLDYNLKLNADATYESWGIYSWASSNDFGTSYQENIEFELVGKWLHENDRFTMSNADVVTVYDVIELTETELFLKVEQTRKGASEGVTREVHSVNEMTLVRN